MGVAGGQPCEAGLTRGGDQNDTAREHREVLLEPFREDVRAPQGEPGDRAGRVRVDHGTLRGGQVDAAAHPGHAGHALERELHLPWTARPEDEREAFKKGQEEEGEPLGLGYKGIMKEDESNNSPKSNQLRLSSIPKGENLTFTFSYNMDGYTQHCKDFKQYEQWLKERNEARYVETKAHGQQIDGKNMAHCMRLINMAGEIASGKGVIVRRPDAEYLLSIRRGELSLEELIDLADEKINNMDELFDNSDLPERVDPDFVHDLLYSLRKEFYNAKLQDV